MGFHPIQFCHGPVTPVSRYFLACFSPLPWQVDWDPELGHRRGARTPTRVTEPDIGPIDKNGQYVILRRLGWVSPSCEHFQNFGFTVILYFDAPRGMVSR